MLISWLLSQDSTKVLLIRHGSQIDCHDHLLLFTMMSIYGQENLVPRPDLHIPHEQRAGDDEVLDFIQANYGRYGWDYPS